MKKFAILSFLSVAIFVFSGCSTNKDYTNEKHDSKTVSSNSSDVSEKTQNNKNQSENNDQKNETTLTQNSDTTTGKENSVNKGSTNDSKELITYKNYANARYLFTIDYPDGYKVEESSANGDGAIISSANNKISVFGSNNVMNFSVNTYFESITKDIKSEIKYKLISGNSFVISYESGEYIIYSKYVVGPGSINTFIFTYPKSESKLNEEIIQRLNSSFKTPGVNEAH